MIVWVLERGGNISFSEKDREDGKGGLIRQFLLPGDKNPLNNLFYIWRIFSPIDGKDHSAGDAYTIS